MAAGKSNTGCTSTPSAANEGRSYVDAVDVTTGKLLDRLSASKPCCVERIPGLADAPTRVLISNLGNATLELAEVGRDGKLKSLDAAAFGQLKRLINSRGNSVVLHEMYFDGLAPEAPNPRADVTFRTARRLR